jgi:hypothetical protein
LNALDATLLHFDAPRSGTSTVPKFHNYTNLRSRSDTHSHNAANSQDFWRVRVGSVRGGGEGPRWQIAIPMRIWAVLPGVETYKSTLPRKGLEWSFRSIKPTKMHSKASQTHLKGFRSPNSDPKTSDFCLPTYNSTSQSTQRRHLAHGVSHISLRNAMFGICGGALRGPLAAPRGASQGSSATAVVHPSPYVNKKQDPQRGPENRDLSDAGAPRPLQMRRARSAIYFGGAHVF